MRDRIAALYAAIADGGGHLQHNAMRIRNCAAAVSVDVDSARIRQTRRWQQARRIALDGVPPHTASAAAVRYIIPRKWGRPLILTRDIRANNCAADN